MSLNDLIRQGTEEQVRNYLLSGIDPKAEITKHDPPVGATALHTASSNGDIRKLKLLLEQGLTRTDVNQIDNPVCENTALDCAVTFGHIDCASLLINAGANVDHLNQHQQNLLHRVITTEEDETPEVIAQKFQWIEFLLKSGINCQQADAGGDTPLYYIKRDNRPHEWTGLLFDRGAGLNCDLTNYDVVPALLSTLTKNKVVIGSTVSNKKITRETPGYSEALTTVAELEDAVNKHVEINFPALILTANKQQPKDEKLISDLERVYKIQQGLKGIRVKSLRSLAMDEVIKHSHFSPANLEKTQKILPTELIEAGKKHMINIKPR